MRKIEGFENSSNKALERAYSLARENGAGTLIFNRETSLEEAEGIAKACRKQNLSIAIADRFEYDLEEEARKFKAAGFRKEGWMTVCTEMRDGNTPRIEQALLMRI